MSPTTLRLFTPLFRFSAARDAYVLRIAGGQYGPVLVDKTVLVRDSAPVAVRPEHEPTGRFQRRSASESAETTVSHGHER